MRASCRLRAEPATLMLLSKLIAPLKSHIRIAVPIAHPKVLA
jgi:hypothetical protein